MARIQIPVSKAGQCARTMAAQRMNRVPPEVPSERLILAAREGSRHEVWIKEDIEDLGYMSTSKNKTIRCEPCGRDGIHVESEYGNIQYVGHMDDVVIDVEKQQAVLGEYKALGRFQVERILRAGLQAHQTYHTQISLYAHMSGYAQAIWVVKNRDTGELQLVELPKDEPLLDIAVVTERIQNILISAEKGELPECDVPEGSVDTYGCTHLCQESQAKRYIDQPYASVLHAAETYANAKKMEDDAKEQLKVSRQVLIGYARDQGDRAKVGRVTISKTKDGVKTVYNIPDHVKAMYEEEVVKPGVL